jgi:hypothetical protein
MGDEALQTSIETSLSVPESVALVAFKNDRAPLPTTVGVQLGDVGFMFSYDPAARRSQTNYSDEPPHSTDYYASRRPDRFSISDPEPSDRVAQTSLLISA